MIAKKKRFAVGWREWVALPELNINRLKAKIDTGARTSALHATDLRAFTQKDVEHIEFWLPGTETKKGRKCSAKIIDRREIKNTSGVAESRIIINTMLMLGRRQWHMEVSLASRDNMEFDLIIGRTALRTHRIAVHADQSFLAGKPHLNSSPV